MEAMEEAVKADDFFRRICDLDAVERASLEAFCGKEVCGELFVEYKESEVLRIENGVVQAPNLNCSHGFGLRTFSEDATKYSYSSSVTAEAVKKAVEVVRFATDSSDATVTTVLPSSVSSSSSSSSKSDGKSLYDSARFIDSVSLAHKIQFLKDLDEYARAKSTEVRQVIGILVSNWQVVSILDDSGRRSCDVRPLTRLTAVVIVERGGVQESGMCSGGGRFGYSNSEILTADTMHSYVDEALRQAEVKLNAIKAPAGEMPVVLGNAWTGILLHEAVGHGLEGDAIRKKSSAFHNLLGEMVGTEKVTVVDDGTIAGRRGSLNVDDEGTPSQRNVLIEKGKLVGFMQDRMNAHLMGREVTGNGRRESYAHTPMPRMTNTFMLAGDSCLEDMVAKARNGIFAKTFSDGQVDTVSGKFVFSASEAYLIEDGKITTPVKGAMLVGDGPSVLKKISMIGADFSLDNGVGTCGKDGQWVPVGVGEPSALIDSITVGGANI